MNSKTKLSPRNRAFTLLVGCLVLAGLVSVAALTKSTADDRAQRGEQRLLVVEAIQAKALSGYSVERQYVGRVEARRESRVGFELSGLVMQLSAEEGQRVEAGRAVH
jgi:multidrug efflux pump subunit AcrA (membrane-fusion protein)